MRRVQGAGRCGKKKSLHHCEFILAFCAKVFCDFGGGRVGAGAKGRSDGPSFKLLRCDKEVLSLVVFCAAADDAGAIEDLDDRGGGWIGKRASAAHGVLG